jgi:ATP synthase protein I
VTSEPIIARLRAEGYELAHSHPGADLVLRGAGFDRLARAAQRAVEREAAGRADPEPSLGARLGQIGVLGWAVVVPTLLFLFLGRWLDRSFGTGIFFSAPLLMVGAAIGLWSAWRWMHRQGVKQR